MADPLPGTWLRIRRRLVPLVAFTLLGAMAHSRSEGAPPKPPAARARAGEPAAKGPARAALLTVDAWQKAPQTPLQPGEIDRLVLRELQAGNLEPALLTTDEQFIRRVTLDLTGRLPLPADVSEFVASTDASKRAQLIDRLLDSEEYAR